MPRTSVRTTTTISKTSVSDMTFAEGLAAGMVPPGCMDGGASTSGGHPDDDHYYYRQSCNCSMCRCKNVYGNRSDEYNEVGELVFNTVTGNVFEYTPDENLGDEMDELKDNCWDAAHIITDNKADKLTGVLRTIEDIYEEADMFNIPSKAECWPDVLGILFIFAAKTGALSCVEKLHALGADINFVNNEDSTHASAPNDACVGTALMHACHNGHMKVVAWLLQHKADVRLTDDDSLTATHVAVFGDRHQALRMLLEAKASTESEDQRGRTPLSWAARDGRETCVHVLAEYGANLEHRDADGLSPLDLCANADPNTAPGATHQALMRLQRRRRLQAKRQERSQTTGGSRASMDTAEKREAEERAAAIAAELLAEEEREAAKAARAAEREAAKAERRRRAAAERQAAHEAEVARAKAEEERVAKEKAAKAEARKAEREARKNAGKAGPSKPTPSPAEAELRAMWNETVEAASRATDPAEQERLKAQLEGMMTDVADAGIGLKHGKKVLARLHEVKPAREALTSAMAGQSASTLKAALEGARKSRSLLPPGMYEAGEARVAELKEEEKRMRWQAMEAHVKSSMKSIASTGAMSGGSESPAPQQSGALAGAMGSLAVGDEAEFDSGSESDSINPDDECVICMENYRTHVCLPCAHTCLCGECAQNYLQRNALCPLCRKVVTETIELM